MVAVYIVIYYIFAGPIRVLCLRRYAGQYCISGILGNLLDFFPVWFKLLS